MLHLHQRNAHLGQANMYHVAVDSFGLLILPKGLCTTLRAGYFMVLYTTSHSLGFRVDRPGFRAYRSRLGCRVQGLGASLMIQA